jgi:hypothetical protein
MSEVKTFKLDPSAQKIVDRKLKEANEYLSKVDVAKFLKEEAKREQAAKS